MTKLGIIETTITNGFVTVLLANAPTLGEASEWVNCRVALSPDLSRTSALNLQAEALRLVQAALGEEIEAMKYPPSQTA